MEFPILINFVIFRVVGWYFMGGFIGGTGGSDPPEKLQKGGSLQYWSRSPEKSQSYQASI